MSKVGHKDIFREKSLLIVDDDMLTINYLESCLRDFTHIKTARDGLEALKLYNEYKFDIILADIYMPKMDGVELAEKIREKNKEQSIVIISTSEDARQLIKLIDIGVNSFLLKPASEDIIQSKIEKVLLDMKHKDNIKRLEFEEMLRKLGNKKYQDKELIEKNKKKVDKLKDVSEDEWLNFKRYQDDSMFLIDDFEKLINKILTNEIDYFVLEDISEILKDLFKIFSIVEEFKGLAKQLLALSDILDTINLTSLNDNQLKSFEMLECILEDIRTYIYDVFIDEKVDNTDYFEKSLMYNINTFESSLKNKQEKSGDILFL